VIVSYNNPDEKVQNVDVEIKTLHSLSSSYFVVSAKAINPMPISILRLIQLPLSFSNLPHLMNSIQ
jgi:hypothetical protein